MRKDKIVVIIDDDEAIRHALTGLMKASDLPARSFASAEDFLNSGEHPVAGCIITDLRMPGISGMELQSRLNAAGWKIPTIFITAHGDDEARKQALLGGAMAFVLKPFDDDALLASVRAALAQ